MPNAAERVAKVEGAVESMSKTLDSIKGYLERGTVERTQHHTLVIERLSRTETLLNSVKEDVQKYQTVCTEDRADLDTRIDEVEKTQKYSAGKASGIAAVVSMIIAGIGYGIEYILSIHKG